MKDSHRIAVVRISAAVLLTACSSSSQAPGNGGTDQPSSTPPATDAGVTIPHSIFVLAVGVGGTGLVLANSNGDTVSVPSNGKYQFPSSLTPGQDYEITVQAQPSSPEQTCDVKNGKGTMSFYDVTDITAECITRTFAIGGTVSGLTGAGLILRNDFGDDTAVTANGPFTFHTKLAPGQRYYAEAAAEPTGQTCTVTNDTGVVEAMDVTTIKVTCAP